jgi:5-methylcytosine-specific restriction endonuclease McrA
MYRPAYGKGGKYGWVVDHKVPKAKGGSDSLRNVQALNTQANIKKGAKRK